MKSARCRFIWPVRLCRADAGAPQIRLVALDVHLQLFVHAAFEVAAAEGGRLQSTASD